MGRTKAHPALCVLQIPKSDYCSGILSALYLISNILYFLLRPVLTKLFFLLRPVLTNLCSKLSLAKSLFPPAVCVIGLMNGFFLCFA